MSAWPCAIMTVQHGPSLERAPCLHPPSSLARLYWARGRHGSSLCALCRGTWPGCPCTRGQCVGGCLGLAASSHGEQGVPHCDLSTGHFVFFDPWSQPRRYSPSGFIDGSLRPMEGVLGLESTSWQEAEPGLEPWPLGSPGAALSLPYPSGSPLGPGVGLCGPKHLLRGVVVGGRVWREAGEFWCLTPGPGPLPAGRRVTPRCLITTSRRAGWTSARCTWRTSGRPAVLTASSLRRPCSPAGLRRGLSCLLTPPGRPSSLTAQLAAAPLQASHTPPESFNLWILPPAPGRADLSSLPALAWGHLGPSQASRLRGEDRGGHGNLCTLLPTPCPSSNPNLLSGVRPTSESVQWPLPPLPLGGGDWWHPHIPARP